MELNPIKYIKLDESKSVLEHGFSAEFSNEAAGFIYILYSIPFEF